MLTAAELTSMRATAAQALPGTAVISAPTFVSDDGGGGSLTYAAGGTVACRISPIASGREGEREMADRISADADFIVTLPVTASVTTDSRLTIDGGTYQVQAIHDRSWEITQRLEVARQV